MSGLEYERREGTNYGRVTKWGHSYIATVKSTPTAMGCSFADGGSSELTCLTRRGAIRWVNRLLDRGVRP